MRVFLGDMELRPSEQPESIQRGGGQHLAVHEFPGGNVSIQNFGPRYREVSWSGWFEGNDAYDRMIKVGNMRQKGDPVELKTEIYTQMYAIKEYLPEYRLDKFIPFKITLIPLITITRPVGKDPLEGIAEKLAIELPTTVIHTVVEGETLSMIALKYFGDANGGDRIFWDNNNILKTPWGLEPGMKLTINIPADGNWKSYGGGSVYDYAEGVLKYEPGGSEYRPFKIENITAALGGGGYSPVVTPASACTLPLKRWMRFQTILRGLSASLIYNAIDKKAVGSFTKADLTVTMTFSAGSSGCVIKSDNSMYVSEALFNNYFNNVLNYLPTGSSRLKKLEWFYITPDGRSDFLYIGGDQSWMGAIIGNSGCGPTAAANMLFYTGRKNSVYLAGTLNSNSIPVQKDYKSLMMELNTAIAPVPVGAYNIYSFADAVVAYGKTVNLFLTPKIKVFESGVTTLAEVVDFIRLGLDNDYPVGLLTTTLFESEAEKLTFKWTTEFDNDLGVAPVTDYYTYHWVTIVELLKDPNFTNDYTVRILTWGTVADLKLSAYFDTSGKFKQNRDLSVIFFANI